MPLSRLVRALCLALPVAVACGGAGESRDGDGEIAGGEAQTTTTLPARHAVDALTVSSGETRAATADLDAVLGPGLSAGESFAVLRELRFDGKDSLIVANASTFRTSVVLKDAALSQSAVAAAAPLRDLLGAVRTQDRAETSLVRDGLPPGTLRFALTIDMCQSSKPWEQRLFDWLLAAGDANGGPLTVGIAMSGGWAKAHGQELSQLLDWQASGKLDIVWVNHSLTHPLHCHGAGQTDCTFLTEPGTDMKSEVLGNEALLLSQGAVPSPLFRFPGLVHDHARRAEIYGMLLFPLDADAWLAKGEPMHDGAVVLVHGNGNEPVGITKLLKIVDTDAWMNGLETGDNALVSPLHVIGKTGS